MDINPKQFLKSNSNQRSSLNINNEEIKKEDDEPLSIWDTSITIFGILLAIITVLLPTVCVLLERPFTQESGVILKQID